MKKLVGSLVLGFGLQLMMLALVFGIHNESIIVPYSDYVALITTGSVFIYVVIYFIFLLDRWQSYSAHWEIIGALLGLVLLQVNWQLPLHWLAQIAITIGLLSCVFAFIIQFWQKPEPTDKTVETK